MKTFKISKRILEKLKSTLETIYVDNLHGFVYKVYMYIKYICILYNFIYFFLDTLSLCCCGDVLQLRQVGATLCCKAEASQKGSFFFLWQSMGSTDVGFSSCSSWALELRLSSCGTRT